MRSGVLNLNVPLPLLHYVANSIAVLHRLGGHCVLKNKTIKLKKKKSKLLSLKVPLAHVMAESCTILQESQEDSQKENHVRVRGCDCQYE